MAREGVKPLGTWTMDRWKKHEQPLTRRFFTFEAISPRCASQQLVLNSHSSRHVVRQVMRNRWPLGEVIPVEGWCSKVKRRTRYEGIRGNEPFRRTIVLSPISATFASNEDNISPPAVSSPSSRTCFKHANLTLTTDYCISAGKE